MVCNLVLLKKNDKILLIFSGNTHFWLYLSFVMKWKVLFDMILLYLEFVMTFDKLKHFFYIDKQNKIFLKI